MKRSFDILFSFFGLLICLPVFIVVAIAIKLDSRGPVFFSQRRIGRGFMPFDLYKLRTMVMDAPNLGPSLTAEGDPRKTRVGRLLRKTKVDELPQLFNVLKGDMSFVGPRPEVEKYVERYREEYAEVLKVRPGITDMASLTYLDEEGLLAEQKDPEEYYVHVLLPEKIRLAKEYVRKYSFLHDLKLIFLTVFRILYPRDIAVRLIAKVTPRRRPLVVGLQVLIFALANYLAFYIRFDGAIPGSQISLFLTYLPYILVLRIVFLFTFSLDKGLWRYASVKDLMRITAATTTGTILFLVVVRYVLGEHSYPRSVYVIDWFLNIFLLGGIRLFRRLHEKTGDRITSTKRVIIIGAGDAAELLIRDIDRSSFYAYEVVGLIDDNPLKKSLKMRNVPILGSRRDLPGIVKNECPDEFLIAIPSAEPEEFEEIVRDLRQYALPIKSVPSMLSVVSGRSSLNSIKSVEPEDVLFRAPVCNNCEEIRYFFKGKTVLITGAGGSIGSELSRQVASLSPERLILFERHEENLYKIDMELKHDGALKARDGAGHLPPDAVTSVIGDVLDGGRLNEIMGKFRPEIVLHAAAYKHVPLMEDNPYEAFKTNVIGTRTVAEKAREYGAEHFVLISTDKAVNPVSVMGMTKKIAERIIRTFCEDEKMGTSEDREMRSSGDEKLTTSRPLSLSRSTKFITVRFGNVLESSGSVVPLFSEQIRRGGPVTVTHPEIIRYFMTIPEAVSLVLEATAMGKGGEVFVLDMGQPVKIIDLARRMISLHGYRPGVDIDITFVGLRPGEKLYEELFNADEIIEKTVHPKINRAVSHGGFSGNMKEFLRDAQTFMKEADIRDILARLAG